MEIVPILPELTDAEREQLSLEAFQLHEKELLLKNNGDSFGAREIRDQIKNIQVALSTVLE